MPTLDIVEAALNAPIDWFVFEKLVVDVLAQDDMPRLRRAGGVKDDGVDAFEAALYCDESAADRIVQITSQRAQTLKVEKTIERLREQGLSAKAITFVFRHPVSTAVKKEITAQCAVVGLLCDVRDQSYLMVQLGKNKTGLFARYFESVKKQLSVLLKSPDPLVSATDPLRHAMLLSVASYVIHPQARLVRRALFQKTTLAALVVCGKAKPDEIVSSVQKLVPEEKVGLEQVMAALAELEKSGECETRGDCWQPTDSCIARFGAVMGAVKLAYEDMRDSVIRDCSPLVKGDQATLGVIERNIRRALLTLLRAVGPFRTEDEKPLFSEASSVPELHACLSNELKDDVARRLLITFAGYVEDSKHAHSLALFARSYSALALRNIDPVGRRWQQVALQRSVVALDTDALLSLLIKELPEHAPLKKAICALEAQGTRIVVSPHVIEEALGHISRAGHTYKRFAAQLDRFSPAMAEAHIWHAVVKGYYYAKRAGFRGTWQSYWNGYYAEKEPSAFLRFQVSRIGKVRETDLSDIPPDWLADFEMLSDFITATKETHRFKAEFRTPDVMRDRVRKDLRMAMHISAAEPSEGSADARGYLATEDRAFFKAEQHLIWQRRRRVAILTRSLPQLAEFVCGTQFSDDEIVRLLYEPAVVAAAEAVGPEIETLTALGVNLRDVSLPRLEWALQTDLHDAIHRFKQDHGVEAKLGDAVGLVGLAEAKGLPVDSFVSELSERYEEAKKKAASLETRNEAVSDQLRRVVLALATTGRAKRRANRVLKELGLSVSALESDEKNQSSG